MSNEVKLNVSQSRGYENVDIKTISSREVAVMMDMTSKDGHSDLMKKIGKINETLLSEKIPTANYWFESTYKDSTGRTLKEYQVTKKGCEMLAHKSTGNKGIIFTHKYMERFEQMENHIKQQIKLPQTPMEVMELMFHALKDTNQEVEEVKADLKDHKENSPLYNVECDELQKSVKKKAVELLGGKNSNAYKDKSIRQQVFGDLQKQIKREFRVDSYKAIKRCQLDKAKEIVADYKLPFVLEQDVYWINNQMSLI